MSIALKILLAISQCNLRAIWTVFSQQMTA